MHLVITPQEIARVVRAIVKRKYGIDVRADDIQPLVKKDQYEDEPHFAGYELALGDITEGLP